MLLAVGLRARHTPPRPEARGSRASAILAGLGNVRPAAAFSMAGLLGFGGPKRLVLTFLAMASVSEASLRDVEDLTLVVVYIAIATVLVSVPVGIVIVAGERAAVILERGQSWLTEHAVALRVWLSLGIGAALIVDALLRLLA
jgi:Sap, sulfolipid-1-addressing protein